MSQRFNFFKKKDLHSCEYDKIHKQIKKHRKRKFVIVVSGLIILVIMFIFTVYIWRNNPSFLTGFNIVLTLSYVFYLGVIAYAAFIVVVLVCQNLSLNERELIFEIIKYISEEKIDNISLDVVEQICTSNSSSVSVQTIIPVVGLPIIASYMSYLVILNPLWTMNIIGVIIFVIFVFVVYYDTAHSDTVIKEAIIRVRGDRSIEKAKVLALADQSRLRRLLETVPRK